MGNWPGAVSASLACSTRHGWILTIHTQAVVAGWPDRCCLAEYDFNIKMEDFAR
jgi:hypothetical protein